MVFFNVFAVFVGFYCFLFPKSLPRRRPDSLDGSHRSPESRRPEVECKLSVS